MKTKIHLIHKAFIFFGFLPAIFFFAACSTDHPADKGPISYSIQIKDGQWMLLQDGDPFYIKGAASVSGRSYMDRLNAYGGNSLRIWRNFAEKLNSAQQNDLTVLMTLPLKGERHGMDWDDSIRVAREKERIMDTVRKYKNHPALMLWSLGNELEIVPGRSYNRKLWDVIDELAVQIHKIDPAHPVMTIISSGGFKHESREIYRQCPNLDLLGINSYHDIAEFCMLARQIWPKPYVITE